MRTLISGPIACHSDEKTQGVYPGDSGENSHVQPFTMMPKGCALTV